MSTTSRSDKNDIRATIFITICAAITWILQQYGLPVAGETAVTGLQWIIAGIAIMIAFTVIWQVPPTSTASNGSDNNA